MTKGKIIQLTALLASVILTAGALTLYSGGFAQKTNGDQPRVAEKEVADPVDSLALQQGLIELQQVIDRYQDASLLVRGEIRYYEGDSGTIVPKEKAPFTFAVEGDKSLYELDSVLTISESELALIIDKKEQSIAIVQKEAMEGNEPAMKPAPAALSDLKEYVKNITTSRVGEYKQLTLTFTDAAPFNILEYVIVFDEKSHAIKKLRMKIADSELLNELSSEGEGKPAVTDEDELFIVDSANNAVPMGIYAAVSIAVYEIVYSEERTIQKGTIDKGNYIRLENEEYVPAGKYKSYSILH